MAAIPRRQLQPSTSVSTIGTADSMYPSDPAVGKLHAALRLLVTMPHLVSALREVVDPVDAIASGSDVDADGQSDDGTGLQLPSDSLLRQLARSIVSQRDAYRANPNTHHIVTPSCIEELSQGAERSIADTLVAVLDALSGLPRVREVLAARTDAAPDAMSSLWAADAKLGAVVERAWIARGTAASASGNSRSGSPEPDRDLAGSIASVASPLVPSSPGASTNTLSAHFLARGARYLIQQLEWSTDQTDVRITSIPPMIPVSVVSHSTVTAVSTSVSAAATPKNSRSATPVTFAPGTKNATLHALILQNPNTQEPIAAARVADAPNVAWRVWEQQGRPMHYESLQQVIDWAESEQHRVKVVCYSIDPLTLPVEWTETDIENITASPRGGDAAKIAAGRDEYAMVESFGTIVASGLFADWRPTGFAQHIRTLHTLRLQLPRASSVTTLGNAFLKRSGIVHLAVSIPSLQSFGPEFCAECDSIESVDFRGCTGVEVIDDKFLTGASSLAHVDLSPLTALATIKNSCLSNTEVLLNVHLAENLKLTTVGDGFCRASGLTRLVFTHKTVATIGEQFCANTMNLRECRIVDCPALTRIGSHAFSSSGVSRITLRNLPLLTYIGGQFCVRARLLEEAQIEFGPAGNSNTISSEAVKIFDPSGDSASMSIAPEDAAGVELMDDFLAHSTVRTVVLKVPMLLKIHKTFCAGTDCLQEFDLDGCPDLREIESGFLRDTGKERVDLAIPTLKKIGGGFCGMSSVREINITGCTALETIGERFGASSRVQKLHLKLESLAQLGESFLFKAHELDECIIECPWLTEIGRNAFSESGVHRITLATKRLKHIRDDFAAFTEYLNCIDWKRCRGLESIGSGFAHGTSMTDLSFSFPQLRRIGDNFAAGAKGLQLVQITGCSALAEIGSDFLAEATVKNVYLHATCIETIGANFLRGLKCSGESEPELKLYAKRIGANLLLDSELTNITLEAPNLVELGPNAFSRCPKLEELRLRTCPQLQRIGEKFACESSAKSITINAPALVDIGDHFCRETPSLVRCDISRCERLVHYGTGFCSTVDDEIGPNRSLQVVLPPQPVWLDSDTTITLPKPKRMVGCTLVRSDVKDGGVTLAHWAVKQKCISPESLLSKVALCQAYSKEGLTVMHYMAAFGIDPTPFAERFRAQSLFVTVRPDDDFQMEHGLLTPRDVAEAFGQPDDRVEWFTAFPEVAPLTLTQPRNAHTVSRDDVAQNDGNLSAHTSIRVLGERCFAWGKVQRLRLPPGLETIGASFARWTAQLRVVLIDVPTLDVIGPDCFADSRVEYVTLDCPKLRNVGRNFCRDTALLERLDIKSCASLEVVGSDMCRGTRRLASVEFPDHTFTLHEGFLRDVETPVNVTGITESTWEKSMSLLVQKCEEAQGRETLQRLVACVMANPVLVCVLARYLLQLRAFRTFSYVYDLTNSRLVTTLQMPYRDSALWRWAQANLRRTLGVVSVLLWNGVWATTPSLVTNMIEALERAETAAAMQWSRARMSQLMQDAEKVVAFTTKVRNEAKEISLALRQAYDGDGVVTTANLTTGFRADEERDLKAALPLSRYDPNRFGEVQRAVTQNRRELERAVAFVTSAVAFDVVLLTLAGVQCSGVMATRNSKYKKVFALRNIIYEKPVQRSSTLDNIVMLTSSTMQYALAVAATNDEEFALNQLLAACGLVKEHVHGIELDDVAPSTTTSVDMQLPAASEDIDDVFPTDSGERDTALTLPHWAAAHFPHALATMFIDRDALCSVRTSMGYTLLHYLAIFGRDVKPFLGLLQGSHGERIDVRVQSAGDRVSKCNGATALQLALRYERYHVAEALVGHHRPASSVLVIPSGIRSGYEVLLLRWMRSRERWSNEVAKRIRLEEEAREGVRDRRKSSDDAVGSDDDLHSDVSSSVGSASASGSFAGSTASTGSRRSSLTSLTIRSNAGTAPTPSVARSRASSDAGKKAQQDGVPASQKAALTELGQLRTVATKMEGLENVLEMYQNVTPPHVSYRLNFLFLFAMLLIVNVVVLQRPRSTVTTGTLEERINFCLLPFVNDPFGLYSAMVSGQYLNTARVGAAAAAAADLERVLVARNPRTPLLFNVSAVQRDLAAVTTIAFMGRWVQAQSHIATIYAELGGAPSATSALADPAAVAAAWHLYTITRSLPEVNRTWSCPVRTIRSTQLDRWYDNTGRQLTSFTSSKTFNHSLFPPGPGARWNMGAHSHPHAIYFATESEYVGPEGQSWTDYVATEARMSWAVSPYHSDVRNATITRSVMELAFRHRVIPVMRYGTFVGVSIGMVLSLITCFAGLVFEFDYLATLVVQHLDKYRYRKPLLIPPDAPDIAQQILIIAVESICVVASASFLKFFFSMPRQDGGEVQLGLFLAKGWFSEASNAFGRCLLLLEIARALAAIPIVAAARWSPKRMEFYLLGATVVVVAVSALYGAALTVSPHRVRGTASIATVPLLVYASAPSAVSLAVATIVTNRLFSNNVDEIARQTLADPHRFTWIMPAAAPHFVRSSSMVNYLVFIAAVFIAVIYPLSTDLPFGVIVSSAQLASGDPTVPIIAPAMAAMLGFGG